MLQPQNLTLLLFYFPVVCWGTNQLNWFRHGAVLRHMDSVSYTKTAGRAEKTGLGLNNSWSFSKDHHPNSFLSSFWFTFAGRWALVSPWSPSHQAPEESLGTRCNVFTFWPCEFLTWNLQLPTLTNHLICRFWIGVCNNTETYRNHQFVERHV